MFNPQYTISHYFLSNVERIAVLSDKINSSRIRLSKMAQLQVEALERNTHSSTSIEGNPLSLAQVSALNNKKAIDAQWQAQQEVTNYLTALRWIARKEKTNITVDSLLGLHALITDKILSQKARGRFKQKQNYVVNEKNIVVYTPPPPGESKKLTKELVSWVTTSGGINPVIVSSIFHHQLLNIHPFTDGNGRVARAASRWILYNRGIDPKHIFALDDYFAQNRQAYYQRIQQVRELDYDFTYWIDYVSEGIVKTIEKTWQRISSVSFLAKEAVTVSPKQEELMRILSSEGALGSNALCKSLHVNRSRVNQLILPLMKAGIIQSEGKARAVKYFVNPAEYP